MPDVTVSSFGRGVDSRREEYAALEGALTLCENGHVTRGGEIENRLAFVSTYSSNLSGSFGLAEQDGDLYVFGSGADPGVPSGVTYQRLQHSSANMTEVLDWDLFDQVLYVVASFDDGSVQHFSNGAKVTDWFDGKARTSFEVTGGTVSAGVNKIDSITINSVDILGSAVDFVTSNAATATAIAAQINTNTSSPNYTAVASDIKVTIISATAGTTPNGYAVSVSVDGDVTTSTPGALATGADGAPGDPGSTVLTHEDKAYTTAGPNMHFSELSNAAEWNPPALGAGFINMSTHATGSSNPQTLETMLNFVAMFAKEAIQIWDTDPDPELYDLFQTIKKSGTDSPRSVEARDDADLMYLSRLGIRSLRVRDSSNKVYVFEVGAPVDNEVAAQRASVSDSTLADAVAVIEPRSGNYWLAIGDTIFVYSLHPSANVAAWSTYKPGFTVKDFCVVGRKLYCRSGDTIYLYGGADFDTYGADYTTKVRIPYLDAGRPSGYKGLQGIDVGLVGEWTIKLGQSLEDSSVLDEIGVFTEPTYDENAIAVAGRSSHIAIEATHSKAERAVLSQFVLHYDRDETDRT